MSLLWCVPCCTYRGGCPKWRSADYFCSLQMPIILFIYDLFLLLVYADCLSNRLNPPFRQCVISVHRRNVHPFKTACLKVTGLKSPQQMTRRLENFSGADGLGTLEKATYVNQRFQRRGSRKFGSLRAQVCHSLTCQGEGADQAFLRAASNFRHFIPKTTATRSDRSRARTNASSINWHSLCSANSFKAC